MLVFGWCKTDLCARPVFCCSLSDQVDSWRLVRDSVMRFNRQGLTLEEDVCVLSTLTDE